MSLSCRGHDIQDMQTLGKSAVVFHIKPATRRPDDQTLTARAFHANRDHGNRASCRERLCVCASWCLTDLHARNPVDSFILQRDHRPGHAGAWAQGRVPYKTPRLCCASQASANYVGRWHFLCLFFCCRELFLWFVALMDAFSRVGTRVGRGRARYFKSRSRLPVKTSTCHSRD